jgi:hypothetical protein
LRANKQSGNGKVTDNSYKENALTQGEIDSQGSTNYRNKIINMLNVPDDISFEKFPSQAKADESKVADELDDTAENDDFTEEVEGKIAPQLKCGSEEIEHKAEAQVYSKSHEFEADTLVKGQDSGRTPVFGVTDDTASGNKKVKKAD